MQAQKGRTKSALLNSGPNRTFLNSDKVFKF